MSRARTVAIAGVVAAGAAAAALAGRAALRHRRGGAPDVPEPPEDLGPVISFDGTALAVRAAGDPQAPVLVFAHGFSLDMSIWHEQWTALSEHFRCILFDHRSHGASDAASSDDLSVRAMGRDVASVLEAAAPGRPVVLVGHSMGAMAILALAEQRPELFGERIAGIALMGSAAGNLLRAVVGGALQPGPGAVSGAVSAVTRRADRVRRAVLSSPGDLSGTIARLTQFGPDAPPHLVDHVVSLAARTRSQVWTDGLGGLAELDLHHALPRVRCPGLVMVGEHDRVTPPAASVELVAGLPDARLVVIPGAGHLAMLERPDETNRELSRFATRLLSPSTRSGAKPTRSRAKPKSPRTRKEDVA